jgi:predicted DNA-binding protein (MmcQ/YjbR family)
MHIDAIRTYCLALPGTTEHVQWGEHLVLKVAGKVYVIAALESTSRHLMSFKVIPETFAELVESGDFVQAPYCAKGQWVALERENNVSPRGLQALIRTSYDLVVAKLPKKTQGALAASSESMPKKGSAKKR